MNNPPQFAFGTQGGPTPGAPTGGGFGAPSGTPNTLGFQQPGQTFEQATNPNGIPGPQSQGFFGNLGDAIQGHAEYAPGGNFGTGANADAFAQAMSGAGQGQLGYNQAQGQAAQQAFNNQGNEAYRNLTLLGNQYGSQAAPTVNMANANAALGQQNNALNMYRQAAMGNGPSAAQAQLQAGLGQSIAAQQSAAASTRGGFGLANAQHDAATQAGQLQAQASNQAAQLRAQEQQAGMAGYAGLGTQIQGQQAGNAQYLANLQQQQAAMNAQNQLNAYTTAGNQQLGFGQAGQNAALGYQQLGQNTGLQYNQLGEQALGQQLSADVANQQSTNQQMSGNAQRGQSGIGSVLGAVGSLGGMVAGLF